MSLKPGWEHTQSNLDLHFLKRQVSLKKEVRLVYKPYFLSICSSSLLKTPWEKEKLLVTSNFSFLPTVFSTLLRELSAIFMKYRIVVCKLFQFERI